MSGRDGQMVTKCDWCGVEFEPKTPIKKGVLTLTERALHVGCWAAIYRGGHD